MSATDCAIEARQLVKTYAVPGVRPGKKQGQKRGIRALDGLDISVPRGTPDELKGELRGDVVQVELPASWDDADPDRVRQVLEGLPAVREVVIAGRDVSARSDDGAAAVPAVLAGLQRAGVSAASVAVARPSLDDVYLRHTGRRYREGVSA